MPDPFSKSTWVRFVEAMNLAWVWREHEGPSPAGKPLMLASLSLTKVIGDSEHSLR